MKRMKRLFALLSVSVLLAVMISPCVYAEESTTYSFSELAFSGAATITDYTYSDDGPKPTMTIIGRDFFFDIPAIDDFPALSITGTLSDEKTREVKENTHDVWGPAGIIYGSYSITAIQYVTEGHTFRTDGGYGDRQNYFELYYETAYYNTYLDRVCIHLYGVLDRDEDHLEFPDYPVRIFLDKPFGTPLVVTGDAQAGPGEDAGVEFGSDGTVIDYTRPESGSDTAKKIGAALGAVAVAAGAGAAVSGDKKKKTKKKNAVSYKMYIYKDFGDAIRKGARPVRVCARITKIEDGKETNDLKLTSAIVPSAEGLVLASRSMYGQYMAANVAADRDYPGDSGIVAFTLRKDGVNIARNMVFRLIGEPQITFPGGPVNGKWDMGVVNDTVRMIAGAGGRERLRFVIIDALEEPKSIRFRDAEGFLINCEHDPKMAFTYYAIIDNNTPRAEKESGIFADKADRQITVEAVFEDGRQISSWFTIELYPDGLYVSVPKDRKKDGCLVADTLPEVRGGMWSGVETIPAANFHVYVCYPDREGHAVIHKNPAISYEEPDDNGKYGNVFRDNFEYHITQKSSTGVDFCPHVTLPVMDDPYYVKMELSCQIDGLYFEEALPLALTGDAPLPPSKAEWESALKGLKKSVRYFGVDNNPQVKQILRHADEHSAAELENARKHVIAAAVKFYEEEYGKAWARMDALYTDYIVVAGSMVKAGDYAVKIILIRGLGKTMGTTVEHIVNPFKNMLFNYIGECIAGDEVSREELEKRFFKALFQGVQDAICETITGDLKSAPENMGYAVSAYLMISFSKHYWGHGMESAKGDVYKSVISACGDLALDKFKAWLSEVLSKCSKSVMTTIGKWGGSLFRGAFSGAVQKTIEAAGNKSFEAGMRPLVQSGSVSTADYLAVKASKEVSQKLQEEAMRNFLSYSSNNFGKGLADLANIRLGFVLNYLMKGKAEDNEALGLKTEDVIVEFLCDRLGTEVSKIYQCRAGYNDISVRLEDDMIKLQVLDWVIEMPMFENIPVFANMLMDFCFGWMEMAWKYAFPSPGEVPDLRDMKEDASKMIENQKELYNSMKPIEYKYYGK